MVHIWSSTASTTGRVIIIVMTRWSKRDLTGQVMRAAAQRGIGEDWKVIEFPAILPSGNPLWPQFWPLIELNALKRRATKLKMDGSVPTKPHI